MRRVVNREEMDWHWWELPWTESVHSRLENVPRDVLGYYAYRKQPWKASAKTKAVAARLATGDRNAARVWGSSAGRRMIGRGQPQTPNRNAVNARKQLPTTALQETGCLG